MSNNHFGFLDNFTLKILAISTMLIDHIGFVFFPDMLIFRAIGRISFPIFCFLIVEGFYHTRNTWNYLIRLLVFALLSELPFDLAFYGVLFDWQHQNVFITLSLGLLALFCLEEMNNRRIYAIPFTLILLIAYVCNCDYGIGGVLLICVFYLTRNNQIIQCILVTLLLYLFYGTLELYGICALIPIFLYNGKRGPSIKMFFYWFYPLHLLAIYFISTFLL